MMQDWMIVAIIGIVVIFGASKLPQIARNVGKAQGEFKKGMREGAPDEEPTPPPAAAPPASAPPQAEAPTPSPAEPGEDAPPAPDNDASGG